MSKYNTTQLNPETTFERHVYHRDQFAHYLRWTHVLKQAKIGQNILDWGSGSGSMLEVFYRNKFKCKQYLGLEYRKQTVKIANEKFKDVNWASFEEADLTKKDFTVKPKKGNWDIITSFEVLEHVGKKNVDKFLKNIYNNMTPDKTILLLSTPIYDKEVGAAGNHIIDGVIGELTFNELKSKLEKTGFTIENTYGTFASIKDYKNKMNDWQAKMFETLKEYYDSNLVSVLMAPMFPEYSRNCLWRCIRKEK